MSNFKFIVQKAGKNEFGITSYPVAATDEEIDQWFKEQWEEQWANHFAATRRFVRLEIEQAAKEPSDPTEDKIRNTAMGNIMDQLEAGNERLDKWWDRQWNTHIKRIMHLVGLEIDQQFHERWMAEWKRYLAEKERAMWTKRDEAQVPEHCGNQVVISIEEYGRLRQKAQWAEKAASVLLSNNTPVKASFAPLHELAATWNQITGEKP